MGIKLLCLGGSVQAVPLLAQQLSDLNAAARKYAGKDSGLEGLAFNASQAGQNRWRGHEVTTVPRAIFTTLFDDIELVANLKGELGRGRRLKGICTDSKGDAREGSPRHGRKMTMDQDFIITQWSRERRTRDATRTR